MRMKLRNLLGPALAVVLFLAAAPVLQAKELVKVPMGWMNENETFAAWLAHERGWDKEEGLDFEVNYFNSGMDIVNATPSGSWVVAGNGAVPGVWGGLRYDTYVIAIGNDESYTNGVLVRPDSPIAKVKGWNKDFPDVLGSPETVRGKTFLCTTMSSPHMALSSWLKVLGLTDKDVVIKNMDQPQALGAFENGTGDGVALWAPHLYVGEAKGWRLAGNIKNCGQTLPIVIQADKSMPTPIRKSSPASCAPICAASICSRTSPPNPWCPCTAVSSWTGRASSTPRKWLSRTSRPTRSSTMRSSSGCWTIPRA